MIGDYLIPTGPDYGLFRNGGPYGACIHDLEAPRGANVRLMTGSGSYPDTKGVSPHIIAGMKEAAQLLTETHAGAHVGAAGNPLLVGFEVTGYATWSRSEWMSDISNLLNQARAVANLWRVRGWESSDLRWGSLAELKEARRRYLSGLPPLAPRLWTHNDVSEALGGTNHWDPGLGFPFADFARWCLEYLVGKGAGTPGGTPTKPNPDSGTPGGAEAEKEDEMFWMHGEGKPAVLVIPGVGVIDLTNVDYDKALGTFRSAGLTELNCGSNPALFDKIFAKVNV